MKNIAVILLNLGGPDSLEAIEPFLYNLFSDKDIFKIPFGQKLFAKIISSRRAPKVSTEYEQIGGSSPINEWTEKQRILLEENLNSNSDNKRFHVITGMRYWHPMISDVAEKIDDTKYDKIILLPLYPHYSITTTGSSFNEWKRYFNGDHQKVEMICQYPDNKKYIKAINDKIDKGLDKFSEAIRKDVQLLFSAHGTPVSLVKKGDPYSKSIEITMNEVMKAREYSHSHHLCFQSKVGPVKWLEPSTDQMIEALASEGKDNMLVIPIAFVSDHVETLFELDIEYRHVADKANVKNYIVMEGLNDSQLFVEALKDEVIKTLNNPSE